MRQIFPSHESAVVRGLSPQLWNLVPLDEIFGGSANNLDVGWGVFEDFMSVTTDTTDTQLHLRSGGAEYMIDTGATLLQLGGNESSSLNPGAGGVLRITTGATDDEEAAFQFCGVGGEPFFVSDTAANARDLIFESRFRTSTITNSELSIYIGLAECAMAVADALTTGAGNNPHIMNNVATLGFFRSEGDGDDLEWIYGANGQATQSASAAKQQNFAVTTAGTALVADTWYKVGFRYYAGSGVITPFFNGTPYTSDNITAANIAAATFPDGEGMSPIVSTRTTATTPPTVDIDWIACAQVEAIG